ncbi:YrhC family protein [Aquibacillus rhizosphaerae]|uniref:YrhC family protein n=1 Tax=Aquibacillus rhizosphaerae TaxID=3051431 RepID=A0ABT7L6K1_9BACI|nr:YrhC family protein [Aquibacillus sp. LR5S19]MDL4841464.1 YrhC family protein [Aquibacillus sp. LR5S19]
MELQSEKIQQRIEDYSRFLITLLILSIYFYLGMVINIFIEPTDKSTLLIGLMLGSLAVAGFFTYLLSKWRKQLNEIIEIK